jgi:hypothetical protein
LAKARIGIQIEILKRQIAGLEQLQKIAEKLEDGSPGEEMLWRLTCKRIFEGDF